MLGWAISDDDAVDAEKKLVRNMLITTGACAVAGFFAGRAIDKKRSYQVPMDPAVQARIRDRLVESEMERLALLDLAGERDDRKTEESSPAQ